MISHSDEGRELSLDLRWRRCRRLTFDRKTLDGGELVRGFVEVLHEVADERSGVVDVGVATARRSICPSFTEMSNSPKYEETN